MSIVTAFGLIARAVRTTGAGADDEPEPLPEDPPHAATDRMVEASVL